MFDHPNVMHFLLLLQKPSAMIFCFNGRQQNGNRDDLKSYKSDVVKRHGSGYKPNGTLEWVVR